MRKRFSLAFLILSTLVLTACGTPAPLPTATPDPTATPSPTNTAAPTVVIRPTATLPPTAPVDLIPADVTQAVNVSPVGLDGTVVTGTDDMPWWNDTVFYEIFVRSFYDSDGDGIGDLQGLIEKLDYLNDGDPNTTDDLGITGLWLMPITQSPSYHGYDVTDYYQVDADYGTNEDFKRLMAEAHQRGIRIIIDMVLNHTSAQHPWFQNARTGPDAEYRDWYIWAESAGLKGWHETDNGYYFGIFWDQMPDLNYENPAVTEEMQSVIRFWLEDMGVDGFRLDAIKHLIEEGNELENTPKTHAWFEGFYTFYKDINPDALTVGEVWSPTREVVAYIEDEVDLAFEFTLADAILKSVSSGRTSNVSMAQKDVLATYPPGQFATFLANHDQNRARSRLLNDEQAKLAATLQLAFPGVPFIYYGEEIAMQGAKPDENIRRPMQWTAEGGFSTNTPWKGYAEDYEERHITDQRANTDSVWQHYDTLIALRNTHEALRIGECWLVESDRRSIYGYVRASDEEVILALVNLSKEPIEGYSITLPEGPFKAGLQPALLMGEGQVYTPSVNAQGGLDPYRPIASIPAYGSVIIQFTTPR